MTSNSRRLRRPRPDVWVSTTLDDDVAAVDVGGGAAAAVVDAVAGVGAVAADVVAAGVAAAAAGAAVAAARAVDVVGEHRRIRTCGFAAFPPDCRTLRKTNTKRFRSQYCYKQILTKIYIKK